MRHGCRKSTGTTGQLSERVSMFSRPLGGRLCPVFGLIIGSPPAQPDTVITTLVNLERALNSVGMQYTHITVDLRLYQTACLVQWNDPLRSTNVILYPGMMHTLMSFLG